ncbi:MAG: N-acetylmuramoyl-L-alanine amidase, partial [Endomicrobiia bacterium]
ISIHSTFRKRENFGIIDIDYHDFQSCKESTAEIYRLLYKQNKNIEIKKEDFVGKIVLSITQKLISESKELKEKKFDIVKKTTSNISISYNSQKMTENVKKKIIVIDPGHGGEDPGAVGIYNNQEKYINLKIAKFLKEKLETDGNFVVFLTRQEDIFVPLVKRTEFANSKNADLFVSIHCNASEKRSKTDHGFEIYFLSEIATDPDAVATEKLENEVVRFEKQTEELTKLQKILWSMIVNEFINESSKLCSLIGQEVTQRTKQNYRGVKQAGFYVLRGAQMPAMLVECGFISNPTEELKLIMPEFQKLIADGIYSGIKKYFENEKN